MKWSPQQDQALLAVDRWLNNSWDGPGDPQVFRLFGHAGTGKSELARHIMDNTDGEVIPMAFTGKAADVMQQKGCKGASTIHSNIYHPKEKSRVRLKDLESQLVNLRADLGGQGLPIEEIDHHRRVLDIAMLLETEREHLSQPLFQLNEDSPVRDSDLLLLDEVSFVDERIGQDVLSFGVKVLVLGDPFQLPPVRGNGFFTDGAEPDIMLTEIHRQARDNPIVAMATDVREGRKLDLGTYGDSSVVDVKSIDQNDALNSDQILVGRNKTRRMYNKRMRELMGYQEQYPIPGDKIVCLRNNHDKGLLNGSVWWVDDVGQVGGDRITMNILSDRPEPERLEVESHMHYFLGREDDLEWWERREADEFDYGYAMTVHKFQGSQDNKILLFDESWCFRKDRDRHLYTGITRAAEVIKVVRD